MLSATTSSGINWLGDVAVPLGVLVISTLFTLWLARSARAGTRRDFEFQRDLRYADEYALAVEPITIWDIVNSKADQAEVLSQRLNAAFNRFCEFASGSADSPLAGYLSHQWSIVDSVAQTSMHALGRPKSELPTDDDFDAASDALSAMNDIVHDWPFPERRRRCLELIFDSRIEQIDGVVVDRTLQIDRWVASADPRPSALGRRLDSTSLWLRGLIEDFRLGRLGIRVHDWSDNHQEGRVMRRRRRADRRADRESLREKYALRRLEDAADRHRAKQGS